MISLRRRLPNGKKKIADIMSSVHAGTFAKHSGRPDGEELEKQGGECY